MNKRIVFQYFFRDGANYKSYGDRLYRNDTLVPLEQIDKRIREVMIDGVDKFHPEDVGLDGRWFCDCATDAGDYHEYSRVDEVETGGPDPEEDILDLIAALAASKMARDVRGEPPLILYRFKYEAIAGEYVGVVSRLIAAHTADEARALGMKHLAENYPGENDGRTFYSSGGDEAGKYVDCQELGRFIPDDYPAGDYPEGVFFRATHVR